MAPPLFAAIRVKKLKNRRELSQAAAHGRRTDSSSRRRVVQDRAGRQIAFSRCSPDDPFDLEAAHRARLAETGAAVINGRALGLHMLLLVTPELICEVGDLHDPGNVRNTLLVAQAIAFCEHTFGEGSVIAGRMDLDEKGGAAVDLFVVPVEQLMLNQHASRTGISVEQPLLRLQAEYGAERSFAALQTAWAQHAKEFIDPRLQRGIPKMLTGKLHVYADMFREAAEQAKADCEAKRSQVLQEIEQERVRLQAEVDAAAQEEARRLREAAQAQADLELDEARARWRAEASEAAAKIAGEREALKRGRKAMISEMERVAEASASIEQRVTLRVDESLAALSSGLAAYEMGEILVVSDSTKPRGIGFFTSDDLTEADREVLIAKLRPAWAAGLASALRVAHHARDAAMRGSSACEVTWTIDRPRC